MTTVLTCLTRLTTDGSDSGTPLAWRPAVQAQTGAALGLSRAFEATEPSRADVDAMPGPVLLEFGAPWCPHCRAVQPLLGHAFVRHPTVRHLKIEDGKGRRLGRSFRVKLWPTLILLVDGQEKARLVRPEEGVAIADALEQIDPTAAT